MQLGLFDAIEDSGARVAAPPVIVADGSWMPPESLAFDAALRRRSLGDAIGILNGVKTEVVGQILLASGFSIGSMKDRKALFSGVQADIVGAAREGLSGREWRAEKKRLAKVVPQEVGGDVFRLTPDAAAGLERGVRVVDGDGVEYSAWSARHGYLEAFPVDANSKAVVFAGNAVMFHLDSTTASAFPERRHDAVYVYGGRQEVVREQADVADANYSHDNVVQEVVDHGRTVSTGTVRASAGGEDREHGSDGGIDSESVDARLAGTGGEDGGEQVAADASELASRGGKDGVVGSGGDVAFVDGRDSENERGADGAADDGVVASPIVGTDYVLTDEDRIGLGGLGEKFADNIQAIRTVKQLAAEGRHAVPEEQRILARYVGWGGLKSVFDPANKQWAKQHLALRSLLSEQEWSAANRSVLDAFYTSPVVVNAMYAGIRRMGFTGGRTLDPSVGVGNFFGYMPEDMRDGSTLHGVELDVLTSQIVGALYPNAKIAQATGFESYKVPAGYFDMVIGNPPFGSQAVVDEVGSVYSGWSIHNYFFAKSIEMLRPGGIMPMVVSHNFMDKLDPHVRQWIARRAELVSGVRLPNTAFQQNANTEVVTDVLVFRRLDDLTLGKQEMPDWLSTTDIPLINGETGESELLSVNNYFINNPQNVLGVQSAAGTMYHGNSYTVEPNGDLEEQLAGWVQSLPEGVYVPFERPMDALEQESVEIPDGIKEGSFFLRAGGEIGLRLPDLLGSTRAVIWEPPNAKAAERMQGMITVRSFLRRQMALERSAGASAHEIETGRRSLNQVYDDFQKKHGFLNDPVNRRLFMDDTESALVQALEFDYEKAVTPAKAEEFGVDVRPARARKADIFSQRVLFPPMEMAHVETAKDALLHSLNQFGRVNMEYMQEAYGKDQDAILLELDEVIFRDPVRGLVTTDEYLSGDVKTKLAEAQKAAAGNPLFVRNVSALEAVIPADKLPSEIFASIGGIWIPAEVYSAFAKEISGATVRYQHLSAGGQWLVGERVGGDFAKNNNEYGTEKLGALDILFQTMNGRGLEVKKRIVDGDGKERYVTDEDATEAVRQRADKIRGLWDSWLWADGARADRLTEIYNDRFNRVVERAFDGSHLTFPGMSPAITLLQHQKNGVWRGVQDRGMLADKVVGSGKTFEMATIAMEMRRLGIARKPLFAVPNHLTLQWRSDFYRLYPGANVLAATPQDFDKENREKLFSKIVTGNWDAIVIGHSSLKKIGVPVEAEAKIFEDQLDEIASAVEAIKRDRGDRGIIRDMEKIKSNLEAKLKTLKEKAGKKDAVVNFEDMGVDALFVDEMHEFKNLFFYTQMQRVAGLGNPAGSGKAMDMFVKIRWLKETFGQDAPLITGTGTPVSNSLAEMFTMQRYMQYEDLRAQGLHNFDAWAKQYGDVQTVYEVAPSGSGYRLSQRFAKFKNLPSLMGAYRGFADVITLDDLKAQEAALGKVFPVPKIHGGRPLNMVAKRSELQEKFFGVPEIVKDDDGRVMFEIDLDQPVSIAQTEDGKWLLKTSSVHKAFVTQEEASLALALGATSPRMTIDPHSIVGQFENLRELTRATKGKINALSLTGLANKAGLDYRLIDPAAPDFEGSKINLAVRDMRRIYNQWHADKGVQLVFCDMSVPLSAKAKMATKEKRIYVRDDTGAVVHKRGTLHSVKEYEGLPYFLVAEGKGKDKTFAMYDAVSGQVLRAGFDGKQEAHHWAARFVTQETGQERWLDLRETAREIDADEIAEYKGERGLDDDGDSVDSEITLADIEGASGVAGFSVYDDIKAKLVLSGVPEHEVQFIHDHDTPQAKEALFKRVNAGDVRFLLGSTPKMGAGTNVQRLLVGLHHIDAPWRPSDLEQREGRIIRRGNMLYERDPENFEVCVNRYATEMTYDTRRWQLLEHKAAGVAQLRNYNGEIEIEDVASEASNSADMKAAASGNPLILKETQLATEVKKLRALGRAHLDQEYSIRSRMNSSRNFVEHFGPKQKAEWEDLLTKRDGAKALLIYDGNLINEKAAAVEVMTGIGHDLQHMETKRSVVYRGIVFKLDRLAMIAPAIKFPDGERDLLHPFSPSGVLTRMDNFVIGLESKVANIEANILRNRKTAKEMAELLGKPFDREADLAEAIAEHGKVQRALMKSNSLAAVKPEERAMFDAFVMGQKKRLSEMGYEQAVREIEAGDDADLGAEGKAVPALEDYDGLHTFADVKAALDKVSSHTALSSLNDAVEARFTRDKQQLRMTDADWNEWTLLVASKANQVEQRKDGGQAAPEQGVMDMENYIKVAADSIGELRKVDVYRVLVESNRAVHRQAIADFIKANRPDLVAEVDSVLADEPVPAVVMAKTEVQATQGQKSVVIAPEAKIKSVNIKPRSAFMSLPNTGLAEAVGVGIVTYDYAVRFEGGQYYEVRAKDREQARLFALKEFAHDFPLAGIAAENMLGTLAGEPDAAEVVKQYRYAMVNRPFGIGTAPKEGFVGSEERPAKGAEHYDYARNGVAVYSRKLTDAETKNFEMALMADGDDRLAIAEAVAVSMGRNGRYAQRYIEMANGEPEDRAQFVHTVSDRIKAASHGYVPSVGDMEKFAEMVCDSLGKKIVVESAVKNEGGIGAVPATVIDGVKWALAALRDAENAMLSVERARGNGHILSLEVREQEEKMKRPMEVLAEFRKRAPDNGVDAEKVIGELGGEPDFKRFSLGARAEEKTAYAEGVTHSGAVPAIRYLPVSAITRQERDFRPEVLSVSALVAAEAPELVEHITGKGKTLRGIIRADLSKEQAAEIDPYTFKKDGGWFIREKHLGAAEPAKQAEEQKIEPVIASEAKIKSVNKKAGTEFRSKANTGLSEQVGVGVMTYDYAVRLESGQYFEVRAKDREQAGLFALKEFAHELQTVPILGDEKYKAPVKEALPGTRSVAQRMVNASSRFVESVVEQFGLSEVDAGKAWNYFIDHKLVKVDVIGGQYSLKDGRLWDGEAMRRAAGGGVETETLVEQAASPVVDEVGMPPEGVAVATFGQHWGRVKAINDGYVIQDTGRGELKAHALNALNLVPKIDQVVRINYSKGSGTVFETGQAAAIER